MHASLWLSQIASTLPARRLLHQSPDSPALVFFSFQSQQQLTVTSST
jgi:hypothetical protein